MIWAIFSSDMRHLLRNVIAAIVVVGLVLVPPLYAWFTTLGFWDPYANTGNINVAVANTDEGYQSDLIPTKINAGEQIVSALRANDQFHWEFVSEDEAIEGVKSGAYYAAIVIPPSFSADLMTVFSGDIKHSEIVYYDNEKENAIAQRVTSTGATDLEETIDQTFTETVANVALGTTSDLTTFMSGDGLMSYMQQLLERMGTAIDELKGAASQVKAYEGLLSSTTSLVEATSSVLKDAGTAPSAVTPLVSEAQKGLSSANKGLTEGASAADQALSSASSSLESVQAAADQAFATMKDDPAAAQKTLDACQTDVAALKKAYQDLSDKLATLIPDSDATAAAAQATAQLGALEDTLKAASSALGSDEKRLQQTQSETNQALDQARQALDASQSTYRDQLQEKLTALGSSLTSVGDDAQRLTDSLQSTAESLGDTTTSLGTSLDAAETSLKKTAAALEQAAKELAEGRDDLQHAVNTGDIDEVRRIIGNNPEAVAQFLAAPTQLVKHPVYAMANNGSAMSPFYTSLCLWIGAIFMVALMSVQVSPQRQAALTRKVGHAPTQAQLYLGRYGVFAVLGLLQAIIVCLGNVFFLGVECQHFWLYLLACCLASVVFTNLVYTLTVSFGNIGKALAIIGLVLQLGGAGGLMPVQMSADWFQVIYPWLPFAHSMEAFQGAMAGIYGNHFAVSMGLLAAFLVPSLILGLVLRRPVIRLNNWFLKKLDETKIV
ncbi:MAG: YhgE/Pip domain-containing protein [Adlercreutzia sp.]|nr:YhgE/Pip domain-containing protein [Adlercreutzia sp.]